MVEGLIPAVYGDPGILVFPEAAPVNLGRDAIGPTVPNGLVILSMPFPRVGV
jgi:hypothetical protein